MDRKNEVLAGFKGKRILVVGLGLQAGGVGIASFFAKLGSKVKVTDLKTESELDTSIKELKQYPIEYTLGQHKLEDFLNCDYIFKGPGVKWDLPELVQAQKKGIPVELEASFVVSLLNCQTIGVTGTRGKSTTTQLIYEILESTGKKIHICGNVSGTSTINLLNVVNEEDIVVFELSSWALSGFHKRKISPNIAVFTNFYPDHLNYYNSLNEYLYDKKAIFMYQKNEDYCVVNESLNIYFDLNKIKSQKIIFSKEKKFEFKYIKGEHNQENANAAYAVSKLFDIKDELIYKTILNFSGLPFRQQIIKKTNEITYINDSTSTTPTSTIEAIKTFHDKPIVLILGGNSKNLSQSDLIDKLSNVEKIILIKGTFTDLIKDELLNKYPNKVSQVYKNLNDAVLSAKNQCKNLDKESYLLFSPGATSFASFKNEFDRGKLFNLILQKI
jgi:UDP-N-acetylmuramoylalanine--D-glutamate ligase